MSDGSLALREGVRELLEDCARAHLPLGIVTTTSRSNVEVLLRTQLGADWAARFATIVCAEEAPLKKPNPQAYLLALESLRILPREAVALEDAPAGRRCHHRRRRSRDHYPQLLLPRDRGRARARHRTFFGNNRGLAAAAQSAGRIDLEQIRRWHANDAARSKGP